MKSKIIKFVKKKKILREILAIIGIVSQKYQRNYESKKEDWISSKLKYMCILSHNKKWKLQTTDYEEYHDV